MLLMVRHAATVRPVATVMLGGLSAAAMSTAGIGLTHGGETALTVLLWHVGAVSLLALVTMAFSRRLFDLIGYRRTTDERSALGHNGAGQLQAAGAGEHSVEQDEVGHLVGDGRLLAINPAMR